MSDNASTPTDPAAPASPDVHPVTAAPVTPVARKLRRSLLRASGVNLAIAAAMVVGGHGLSWNALSTYLVVAGVGLHVAATARGWHRLTTSASDDEKALGRLAARPLLAADAVLYAGLAVAAAGTIASRL